MTEAFSAAAPVLVIDGHNDLPWALRQITSEGLPTPGIYSNTATHTDIERMRTGGVGAQFFSVYVPDDLDRFEGTFTTLEQIALVRRIVAEASDVFELASKRADVERIMASNKIAVMLGAEGAHSTGYSSELLGLFRSLGVLYMTLTHIHSNPIAESATDPSEAAGLSSAGRDFVREMNDVGMLIDISHVSQQTATDVLALSSSPVIYSHSSCLGITPHVRNASDANLAALNRNGGVIMIAFVAPFVAPTKAAEPGIDTGATLFHVADHIDYAREVAGLAHIGIGSDFDGTQRLPRGLEDVSKFQDLFNELRRRRWSDAEIEMLAHRNVLRVIGEVCG